MSQVDNRDEREAVTKEVPSPQADSGSPRRPLSPDQKIGLLLSVVGILFGAAAFIPGWGRVMLEVLVGLLLISVVLWFDDRVKKYIKGVLPAVVIIILVTVLCELSFRLWENRTSLPPKDKGPRPANVTVTNDRWTAWENRIRQDVEKCGEAPTNDAGTIHAHDVCIAQKISSNSDYPPPESSNAVDKLNADIHAGYILMNIKAVFGMLKRNICVQRNFLGDGLALPNSDSRYWKPRVPEYLVSQLRESNPNLWTWELPLSDNEKNLKEIIAGPPRHGLEGRTSQKDFLKYIQDSVKTPRDPEVVVRFARFPRSKYENTLGPPVAKRVFVLRLRDVYEMTFQQAANLSGLKVDDDPKYTAEDKLWVWIYKPTLPADLLPPTWGEIIPNIKDWVEK